MTTKPSQERQAGAESTNEFIEICINGRFVQVPKFSLGYAFNQLILMSDADVGFEDYVISVGMLLEEMIEGGFEFSQLSCPPPKQDIASSSRYVGNRSQSLAAGESQLAAE